MFKLAGWQRVPRSSLRTEADSGKELVDMTVEKIDSGEIEGKIPRRHHPERELVPDGGGDCILKRATPKKPLDRRVHSDHSLLRAEDRHQRADGLQGHTRCQLSPQQLLNYNASGSAQFGALQTKTPWIGPVRAFETNETDGPRPTSRTTPILPMTIGRRKKARRRRSTRRPG